MNTCHPSPQPIVLPKMSSIEAVRAANAAFEHPVQHVPLAIFVGGTSGVGQGMVEVFATNTHGKSHIVIVGRNRGAAENTLSSVPTPASGTYVREFIYCDVTLMKNVQALTQDILSRYPKINYLVISTGFMALGGRNETEEGIDKKLAVHYYSRWKIINDLLPALRKAQGEGEKVSVMSVLAAGKGGAIDVIHRMDDLAVKDGYWMMKLSLLAPTYNDLMLESFAEIEPNIPFIHSYPGFVRTTIMASSPSWFFRTISTTLFTLTRPFSVSMEESGQYMWNAIYNVATKPRAWRTGYNGEDIGKTRYFGDENQRQKLWEHTVEVMKEALTTDTVV